MGGKIIKMTELNQTQNFLILHYWDLYIPHHEPVINNFMTALVGSSANEYDRVTQIKLPSSQSGGESQYVDITPLNGYANWSILLPQSSTRRTVTFECPSQTASIFPFFNIDPSFKARHHSLFEKQQHNLNVRIQNDIIAGYSPIIIAYISYPEASSIVDLIRPQWWHTNGLEHVEDVREIEIASHNFDVLPTTILDTLNIPQFKRRSDINASDVSITIDSLNNAQINYQNLGVEDGAAEGFVRDCLKSLTVNGTSCRIWADFVPIHRDILLDDIEKTPNEGVNFLRDESLWLKIGDNLIIKPFLRQNHYQNLPDSDFKLASWLRLSAAYWIYLEVNGLVYDSFMASSKPIPIGDYQRLIHSKSRESVEIHAGTTYLEALNQLYGLVRKARYTLEFEKFDQPIVPTIEYRSHTIYLSLCFAQASYIGNRTHLFDLSPPRSEAYIRTCVPALIDCGQDFRIWVDSVPQLAQPQQRKSLSEIRPKLDAIENGVFFGDERLSFPVLLILTEDGYKLSSTSEVTWKDFYRLKGAYHSYIEYNHMAYDNHYAFAKPIPITEYQQNLKSSWRDSVEITSQMTLEDAELAFTQLIERSRTIEE